ncbi:MAG: M20/M25/M40 family metallo-hydrolase [Candidatus Krumholzibacteria bacterium]|nr:M20/M25/M40 family metallo-hydrolase [Candidatus Krumholzibacteria bacterium]
MRRALKAIFRISLVVDASMILLLPAGSSQAQREAQSLSGGGTLDARHERIVRVCGEVFSGTQTPENLRVLCDEIGGRVAGTEAGKQARSFAVRLFNQYGLRSVHQEPFDMFGWERGPFRCEITSPRRIPMHAVALANTPSTPQEGIEAAVVDVGHGSPEELERLGDDVRGKFVLAVAGRMPGGRWLHRFEVTAIAAEHGAAGLLYQTTQPGNLPMTGMCWRDGTSPIPGAGISREDGELIKRQLESGEEVVVRLQMSNLTGTVTSANVVGEIAGRGREFVLIGAHLDAWDLGQGAVDNGTGAVVIIEAARALAAIGVQPEATIRFVLFMGEEMGLYGSNAYAASHSEELSDCRAMINCDMTGTPLGLRVMGHEEAAPFFFELLDEMKGFDLSSGISHSVGIYGDHQPFLLEGVPVLTPISRLENECWKYYHTSADTYDKVTFRQLNLEAAFVAALALELASTPERVMNRLDRHGVEELVKEHSLEEALRFWGEWPLKR